MIDKGQRLNVNIDNLRKHSGPLAEYIIKNSL